MELFLFEQKKLFMEVKTFIHSYDRFWVSKFCTTRKIKRKKQQQWLYSDDGSVINLQKEDICKRRKKSRKVSFWNRSFNEALFVFCE